MASSYTSTLKRVFVYFILLSLVSLLLTAGIPAAIMTAGLYSVGAAPFPGSTTYDTDGIPIRLMQEPRSLMFEGIRTEYSWQLGPTLTPKMMLQSIAGPGPTSSGPKKEYRIERGFGFPYRSMLFSATWYSDRSFTLIGGYSLDDLGSINYKTTPLRIVPRYFAWRGMLMNWLACMLVLLPVLLLIRVLRLSYRRRHKLCMACGHHVGRSTSCPQCLQPRLCVKCGYELGTLAVCPECGRDS
jgi:predicted RNA-binding Zn-ribbon protein involved in translation (DUF1610 family)